MEYDGLVYRDVVTITVGRQMHVQHVMLTMGVDWPDVESYSAMASALVESEVIAASPPQYTLPRR